MVLSGNSFVQSSGQEVGLGYHFTCMIMKTCGTRNNIGRWGCDQLSQFL